MTDLAHRIEGAGLRRKTKDRVLRADTLRHSLNPGKATIVAAFVRDYRRVCVVVGRRQWRAFFEAGATDQNAAAKDLNPVCGAAPVQAATRQVVEQIESWLGNRANDFARTVQRSELEPETRRLLHAVNRRGAWFTHEDMVTRDGEIVPDAVRALARTIMRHVMARHRRPGLGRLSPRLDARMAVLATPTKAKHADLWARLRLPGRPAIHVPLHGHERFWRRPGPICPVVQIVAGEGALGFRLVADLTDDCRASREAYVPRTPRVGVDFGLATLMATDNGDLFGRGFLAELTRINRQIVGIARHRQRAGEKPRDSARYRRIVTSLRGMIRTRVNAALNRIVAVHAPAELVLERLDFANPNLSRRLNRILTNCGRATVKAKLADLEQRFGITAVEVNPAYSSRECAGCGYVDGRNRRSQTEFVCLWCGRRRHADAQAGAVITLRRSQGLDGRSLGKADILAVLTRRHVERWPGISPRRNGGSGTAADPRLSNRYFAKWAAGARMRDGQGVSHVH